MTHIFAMDIVTDMRSAVADAKAALRARAAPIIDRLLSERSERLRTTLLLDLYTRQLRETGIAVARATLHLPTLHPQISARSLVWELEAGGAVELDREHGIRNTALFLRSPLKSIFEGGPPIRRRLNDPNGPDDYPILADLRDRNFTDYLVRDLPFSVGKRNGFSVASNHPDGFSDDDLALIEATLPAFGAVLELRQIQQTARALLDTYVGRGTGQRVLNGAIKRGDGEVIHAVLWYCDLRNFTGLSGSLPLDGVIELLNAYHDCMAGPVERRGGEILKFIGDAMLAIFPCRSEPGEACIAADSACAAAEEAVAAVTAANAARATAGLNAIRCGIAVHIGDVMYGNIGSSSRLDFTVIGPAVNLVSRLEGLSAQLGSGIVVSSDIARLSRRGFRSLGAHALKGIPGRQEAFTLA